MEKLIQPVLWLLLIADASAFLQPIDARGVPCGRSSQHLSPNTQLHLFDTIKSLGNIPPSQSILSNKKEALKSLLKGTFLETNLENVKCVYKASKDGWSAVDFHRCVDGKGSALAVALTRTGILLGGYNPSGWSGTDDYYLSNNAFLWYAKPGSGSESIVKCPIYPGGMCLFVCSSSKRIAHTVPKQG